MLKTITSIILSVFTGISLILILLDEVFIIYDKKNLLIRVINITLNVTMIIETLTGILGILFIIWRRIFRRQERFVRSRWGVTGLLILPLSIEISGAAIWMIYLYRFPITFQRSCYSLLWKKSVPIHSVLITTRLLAGVRAIQSLFELDDTEEGEPLINY
jgi:hypothetical protein